MIVTESDGERVLAIAKARLPELGLDVEHIAVARDVHIHDAFNVFISLKDGRELTAYAPVRGKYVQGLKDAWWACHRLTDEGIGNIILQHVKNLFPAGTVKWSLQGGQLNGREEADLSV